MKFCDKSRPLYTQTDASGVSLEAELIQVRDGMNCGDDKVLDNTTLQPIAFVSKSYQALSSATAI